MSGSNQLAGHMAQEAYLHICYTAVTAKAS